MIALKKATQPLAGLGLMDGTVETLRLDAQALRQGLAIAADRGLLVRAHGGLREGTEEFGQFHRTLQ
ncbi:hypothetical protein D3C86_2052020 [compost metagenome]